MSDLARRQYPRDETIHRLVLLAGPAGCGKTRLLRQFCGEASCSLVNVNLELPQGLLDVPRHRRPASTCQHIPLNQHPMKYSDLNDFEPMESFIKLREADSAFNSGGRVA